MTEINVGDIVRFRPPIFYEVTEKVGDFVKVESIRHNYGWFTTPESLNLVIRSDMVDFIGREKILNYIREENPSEREN